MDLLTTYFPQVNLWLMWGIFLLANLPGMYLFFEGFWRYLVWVSALNLVVRQLVETGNCSDLPARAMRISSRSVDYSVVLTFLFGVVFVPFAIALIPIALMSHFPDWYWGLLGVALLTVFVGLLLVCVLLIFCSLVFQVFAFTPGPAGACLFRSIDLVGQNVVKTLVIIAISVGITQFALPSIVVWMSDLVHATHLLAIATHGFVQYLLNQSYQGIEELYQDYAAVPWILGKLLANPWRVALELTRIIIYTFTSAFLLPLGTCWFALLYGDLKTRFELRELPVDAKEKATPLA